MSYTERLAQQLAQAPARETFNSQQKPAYDWAKEAGQKRSVR
jgi:hypothetical protein